jgi:hypothetical protein
MKKFVNDELKPMQHGLEAVKTLGEVDFAILSLKNIEAIKAELKVLGGIKEGSKEFNEKYIPKLREIAIEHCDKNDKGKPDAQVTEDGGIVYSFNENRDAYNKAVLELEATEEMKPLVEEQNKKNKQYAEAMLKEATVKLFPIPKSLLPKSLNAAQLEPFFGLVDEKK